MYQVIKAGLMLAVIILVFKIFLPDVASGLIELISKIISIAIEALNQVQVPSA